MKAIALISGGLDSTLAARLMQELGVELVCLNTASPFCQCNHRSAQGCFHGAQDVARNLGLKLVSINVTEEFLPIVRNPEHGYGSHLNPCIDCRILLFKKAKELMQKEGASFLVSGEVLGQRPMSQRKRAMHLIEKEAGVEGLVLRPLSARVLPPTIMEKQGWIERDKLLAIVGRRRSEQFALAQHFGIKDYPCPAGGCLLTDPGFSRRLKDLMEHDEFNLENILLLKIGRHFRLNNQAKLVVGRNEEENKRLSSLSREGDLVFLPEEEVAGPTCLGRGKFDLQLIELACGISSFYCDLNGAPQASILYNEFSGQKQRFDQAIPLEKERLEKLRI
ncbi:MAG: hypothetical protein PHT31_03935 [Candidatus Omnitrophica bacterium]|nr:hypothetical protein [Candidatus Omnitrophota bacterium]